MKTIKIEGMHCSHCVDRVTKALGTLGLSVKIELSDGIAVINGDNIPCDETLREIVEDLGFDVTSIK